MSTYDTGEDLLQPVSRTDRFDLPAIQTIFKLEEGLADRVREGHPSRIYKGDITHSPSLYRTTVQQAPEDFRPTLTISTRAT